MDETPMFNQQLSIINHQSSIINQKGGYA